MISGHHYVLILDQRVGMHVNVKEMLGSFLVAKMCLTPAKDYVQRLQPTVCHLNVLTDNQVARSYTTKQGGRTTQLSDISKAFHEWAKTMFYPSEMVVTSTYLEGERQDDRDRRRRTVQDGQDRRGSTTQSQNLQNTMQDPEIQTQNRLIRKQIQQSDPDFLQRTSRPQGSSDERNDPGVAGRDMRVPPNQHDSKIRRMKKCV